jgi:hypothetical protein
MPPPNTHATPAGTNGDPMLTLITAKPTTYTMEGVEAVHFGYQRDADQPPGGSLVIEPVFSDFKTAGDNELGCAFVCVGTLSGSFNRTTVALTYSKANAAVYKGYVLDLEEALKKVYPHVKKLHVPYVSCGAPIDGSVLTLTGSHTPFTPYSTKEVVMPSVYFEGLLSHVLRNRPTFPISCSARGIGAVRSDLNLLPAVAQWKDKSLMVEYRDGKTTKLQRLKREHVGKLFGVAPCNYTADMIHSLPANVIAAFM